MKKTIAGFLIMLFLIVIGRASAVAFEFDVEELDYSESRDFFRISEEAEFKGQIENYAISENGWCVIATCEGPKNRIYIFDNNMVFQRCLYYGKDGQNTVDFEGENLAIYYGKSGRIIMCTVYGEVIGLYHVPDVDAYYAYITYLGKEVKKTEDGYFQIQREWMQKNRLIFVDNYGKKTVVFQRSKGNALLSRMELWVGLVTMAAVFFALFNEAKRKEKNKELR